jgi:hypothetical protein
MQNFVVTHGHFDQLQTFYKIESVEWLGCISMFAPNVRLPFLSLSLGFQVIGHAATQIVVLKASHLGLVIDVFVKRTDSKF